MKNRSIISLLAVLALGIAMPAHAADSQTNTISTPALIEGEMPDYPQIARELKIEGLVIIECLVDERGQVLGAEVIRSVNPDLDAAALAAVNTWKFSPAVREGKAQATVVQIPVRFELKSASGHGPKVSTAFESRT